MFDTMKAASLLQKLHYRNAGIISPYEVLRMATVGGAKALNLDGACGTIEPGKRADLILVKLDTLHNQPVNDAVSQIVHCAKASDVQSVMADGEWLMRERQLMRHDEKALLESARAANRDLMSRVAALPI